MTATPSNLRRANRHKSLLNLADEDPLASVANLFDAAIVLCVGLMLAIVAALQLHPSALSQAKQAAKQNTTTATTDPATGELVIERQTAQKIERLTPSDNTLSGEGTKLGTAYQLKDGQIIYVPEGK
ncbi:MAG: DUF2149 domain-containing protein [Planctomycetaceae bacterium]